MTYTVRDLEQRYGVREHTILAWIKRGDLKALNVGVALGKQKPRYRITQAALDAFEALRAVTPPAPRTHRRKRSTDVLEFIK